MSTFYKRIGEYSQVFFFLFFSPPGTLGNSGNFLVVITSWEYSVWY